MVSADIFRARMSLNSTFTLGSLLSFSIAMIYRVAVQIVQQGYCYFVRIGTTFVFLIAIVAIAVSSRTFFITVLSFGYHSNRNTAHRDLYKLKIDDNVGRSYLVYLE